MGFPKLKWFFGLVAGLFAAGVCVWFVQSGVAATLFRSYYPPSESDKIETHVYDATSHVLERVVGKGKFYVTVKAYMTDKAESTEQWVMKPGVVTVNQTASSTAESEREILDPEAVSAFKKKKPIQKITQSLPGFPVLNPVDPSSIPQLPTQTVHLPAKTSHSFAENNLYFNQERTVRTSPIRLSHIMVHVIVDERQMKVLKLDRGALNAVLAEVAGINENRGDELILSSYQFSNSLFGLDEFYRDVELTVRRLGLPPEFYVAIFGGFLAVVGLVALVVFWRRRAVAKRLQMLQMQEVKNRQVEKESQEHEREFHALCRALLDFVEKNTSFTANVLSEMSGHSGGANGNGEDHGSALTGLKKVLIFILFVESEKPELVGKLLLEMGEVLSKSLFGGINKLLRVDRGVLRSVLEEFYHMFIQKQVLIGGPTISQKILETTFGDARSHDGALTHEFLFQFLDRVTDDRLFSFLSGERLQVSALILSFLDEGRVVSLLSIMDVDRAAEVSRLMLTLSVPSFTMIQKYAQALEVQLLAPEVSVNESEKLHKMVRIMERLTTTLQDRLLEFLSNADPVLSNKIRSMVFQFDDFMGLSDIDLRSVLFECDVRQVGLAVLRCNALLRDKVVANGSERIRQVIQETLSLQATFKDADIERAQHAMIDQARQLAESGRIVLGKAGL